MSEVTIKYSQLENTILESKKVRSEIEDYVSEVQNRIITSASNLPGSDSNGYVSTAVTLARRKIVSLNSLSEKFSHYESNVSSLISNAKEADKRVASKISKIADAYIEKREWYQRAGDWIYDTFCVDLANSNTVLRSFCDAVKWCTNKIGNGQEIVYDWFKYGNGKYVWNIGISVVKAIVAVGGAIIAICAIPFTSGATVPIVIGCVGAAAASISAIITTANSGMQVYSNSKALSLEEKIGAARYYGNVSTWNEYWKRTDMGGEDENKMWETGGEIIDIGKATVDTVVVVSGIASLGNVKDLRVTRIGKSNINTRYNQEKWYKAYSFTPRNIIKNLKNDMGIKVSKNVKNGRIKKGVFIPNIFEKDYTVEKKFTFRLLDKTTEKTKSWSVPQPVVTVFKGGKMTKNFLDNAAYISDIGDYVIASEHTSEDTAELMMSFSGLGANTKFFKPINDYLAKTGKNFNNLYDTISNEDEKEK